MIDPPNLDELAKKFGGYSRIPQSAWQDYEDQLDAWKLERGIGYEGNYDRGNQVVFIPKKGDEK